MHFRALKRALRALFRQYDPDLMKNRRYYYGRKTKAEGKSANAAAESFTKSKNDARFALPRKPSGTDETD